MSKRPSHAEIARIKAEIIEESQKTFQKRAENEKKKNKIMNYSKEDCNYGITLYDYKALGFCTEEDIDYFLKYYLMTKPNFNIESFNVGVGVSLRRDPLGRTNFSVPGNHTKIIDEFKNFLIVFNRGIVCGLNDSSIPMEYIDNSVFMKGYDIGIEKYNSLQENNNNDMINNRKGGR